MATYSSTLKALEKQLRPGESISASCYGLYETRSLGSDTVRNGVLAVTQTRVILFGKGLTGSDIETFDIASVTAVEMSKKLLGRQIVLRMSGNDVKIKSVNKGEPDAVVRLIQDHKPQPSTPAAETDVVAQIERLAALRDSGAISEAEYNELKARHI